MKRFALVIPVLGALLTSCATVDDPQEYRAPPGSTDTGQVCLYRTAEKLTPGAWLTFTVDGQLTGEIRPDRQYCTELHAGKHIVRVDGTDHAMPFTLSKDEKAYIRFDESTLWFQPVLVDGATGEREVAMLRAQRNGSTQ
jgi:hypothetical protein